MSARARTHTQNSNKQTKQTFATCDPISLCDITARARARTHTHTHTCNHTLTSPPIRFCDTQSDSDEEENSQPLSYRLKLHAADPRYITNSEDCNRDDVILTVGQVRELIAMKDTSEEGTATIWLTTADMGF